MKKLLLVLVILMFAASFAYAAEAKCASTSCKVCENLKSDDMAKVYGARLINGVCNAGLGWTEIFFRPGKVVAAGGNPIVGFFRGLGNAVARTGAGALELATFWTPGESVVKIYDCPVCAYK